MHPRTRQIIFLLVLVVAVLLVALRFLLPVEERPSGMGYAFIVLGMVILVTVFASRRGRQ